MGEEIRICEKCKHYCLKKSVKPFGKLDVWTPDILAAKTEWDKEQAELALIEQRRFDGGEEFDYEPNNFAWCAQWTEKEDRYIVNPVSGSKSRIFILCARANTDGKCSLYEAAQH